MRSRCSFRASSSDSSKRKGQWGNLSWQGSLCFAAVLPCIIFLFFCALEKQSEDYLIWKYYSVLFAEVLTISSVFTCLATSNTVLIKCI